MGDQGWGWMCWLLSPSLSHPRATPAVVFPSHLQPGPPPLAFLPPFGTIQSQTPSLSGMIGSVLRV